MDSPKRVALVTGAARGIGRAIAIDLAKEGANVIVNYRSRPDAAEEVIKGWGRIINISSDAGLHGYPGDTAYGAAKAGLIGFTKSLAKEVAKKNITVNVVIPGFLRPDMTSILFTTEERLNREIERIPLGRPGKPEEVAEMVSFLAFKGSYITGGVIQVDGGMGM